jgi:chromosome segregation and condensation protein ScpB
MYSEISDFFGSRSDQDPLTKLFHQEAVRIHNNFADVGTLATYKNSKAFRTVQKRQGAVANRLNTIKENFTKKRE